MLVHTLATGCASLRPLDPEAGPIELREGEGLVVLHVKTGVSIESIRISGVRLDGPEKRGTTIQFLAAKPGRYAFETLTRRSKWFVLRWRIRRGDERVAFDVLPGHINYPGQLIVRSGGGSSIWETLAIRVANRTAMLDAELDRRFPDLKARYPLRYAAGRDDFLEALAEARSKGGPAADEAEPES